MSEEVKMGEHYCLAEGCDCNGWLRKREPEEVKYEELKCVEYHKNFDCEVPDWQSILEDFSTSLLEGAETLHICPSFFVSHNSYRIPEVGKVLSKVGCRVAHSYINLAATGDGFGWHSDDRDVWFWQVQGYTKWELEGGAEYLLSPGDLLEVPKQMSHRVTSSTPRCGISMSRLVSNKKSIKQ